MASTSGMRTLTYPSVPADYHHGIAHKLRLTMGKYSFMYPIIPSVECTHNLSTYAKQCSMIYLCIIYCIWTLAWTVQKLLGRRKPSKTFYHTILILQAHLLVMWQFHGESGCAWGDGAQIGGIALQFSQGCNNIHQLNVPSGHYVVNVTAALRQVSQYSV